MNLELLLHQVKQINEKYDQLYRDTGVHFNIFDIAHFSTDEVRICRVIKELIDPKGFHYQGEAYLSLFMRHVLGRNDFNDAELKKAIVKREKLIDENRRIDLFIKIPGKAEIPIEVKINAGDQHAQCADYCQYAVNAKLYYLTLDGHKPSDDSLQHLNAKDIKMISFGKEIITWLEECLKLSETVRLAPIREIICQFIDILRKLTGQSEDKMEREVVNLILESEENFKNVELLANTLKPAENAIFDRFFKELHQQISDKYPEFPESGDFDDEEYDQYGIYYTVKRLDDGNLLCLDITCVQECEIYAGFVIYDENDVMVEHKRYFAQEDIMTGNWKSDDYWVAWEYLGNDPDERPNFKFHNDAFYALLKPTGMTAFVDASMETIALLMSSLAQ